VLRTPPKKNSKRKVLHMYIGNLTNNTPCVLFIKNEQNKSIRLETIILERINDFSIKLQACWHQGKLINISGHQCVLEVVAEEHFFTFELGNVLLQKEETPVYLITCTTSGKIKNRRGAVRVPASGKAVLRVGDRMISDCHVYDLSYTGIAFSIPKGQAIAVGDSIAAGFKYKWEETTYQVKGRVARVEVLEGKYDRIGIEFLGVYKEIDKLVAEIQRDKVAAHKRELLRKKI